MNRRQIHVRGIVQGVGFRPFVYSLASKYSLVGSVKNQMDEVLIDVEGEDFSLDSFLHHLTASPPPLARIEEIYWSPAIPQHKPRFEIEESNAGHGAVAFMPSDIAACEECIAELWDPCNRRFQYPFLNCAHCGPRLTIIQSMPYDRERTTMRSFPMCLACLAEYEDPADRRFHAEAIACPRCGPRLEVLDSTGEPVETNDPINWARRALDRGQIAAIKGLGGFHLVCAAANQKAVLTLRQRKRRDEKPVALMVRDVLAAEQICEVSSEERSLLVSSPRPIVLLRKRAGVAIADAVAPGNRLLGVMLPYTPLHHLLAREFGAPLVLTSGNESDGPITYEDADIVRKLGTLADFFLTHNRRIFLRCDDSVARVVDKRPILFRRSRGFAPAPFTLPTECGCPMLAMGGQLKTTFALGRENQAVLSHHLGDLDHWEAFTEYNRTIEHYQRLFGFEPELFVHDLHPDYSSTRRAIELAAEHAKPSLAVQHHHAHMASCMAENGIEHRAIGVIFDGTGMGTDQTIWGGEFLIGDCSSFQRAAHFRCVPMPGGEQAIREPWRMGLAHLLDAGEEPRSYDDRIATVSLRLTRQMIAQRINSPVTSSCGRLFDAVASMIGLRDSASYEGQPAMELEWLAEASQDRTSYPFRLENTTPMIIDTRPLIAGVARDSDDQIPKATIARRVHTTLIEIVITACEALRRTRGLNTVVLSGGVFMNGILCAGARVGLRAARFDVFTHSQVPPNDGGLALGQLAIAAAQRQKT